ncbi:MAG TPA: glycosyltransferase [Chitinivibrionales bacterium]|nr:glycosyltransferase [Chitinivibrionales bacterium]
MTLTLALSAKNASSLQQECFDSIARQTEKPDSVFLILDDVSKPLPPFLHNFAVKVLPNEGIKLFHARNTALHRCNTDILAFTDTDCVLDENWVRRIKNIFTEKPEAAAGTGAHPMIGRHNFSSWLHHMWFVVETKKTGYTDGVIGGNSYFRTDALKKIGGWLQVNLMAAEDVYISMKLQEAGYKIWFDDGVIARHHYKAELLGFLRQTVMMGFDIVIMMKTAGIRNFMWYYTLCIPVLALLMVVSVVSLPVNFYTGAICAGVILAATLVHWMIAFKSAWKGLTRWLARWVIIWPYSWGIVKGLFKNSETNRLP